MGRGWGRFVLRRPAQKGDAVMPLLDRERSALLVIDFQARLMPSIEGGPLAIANA
jgi:hypothetical protein